MWLGIDQTRKERERAQTEEKEGEPASMLPKAPKSNRPVLL